MNLFDVAYKAPRLSSTNVFSGFGFKHRSDISPYCHALERAAEAAPMCQAAAEGIRLLADALAGWAKSDGKESAGDYWTAAGGSAVYLELSVPRVWRDRGVVDAEVHSYRAHVTDRKLQVNAFDRFGQSIPGNTGEVNRLYKLLPAFAVLAAREMERNPRFMEVMGKFMESPAPDLFAQLHEMLYRQCRDEEFDFAYRWFSGLDKNQSVAFSELTATFRRNRAELADAPAAPIVRFAPDEFSAEIRELVPNLPGEFELSPRLRSVCNAIRNGDVLAALFHGPAGTGKTMACKLVCQAVGLPVMETINCTENLDEFVLGKFLPEGREIVFRESQVAKAVREGGAVVFEEINFAKPQYLAFLNSLLDDNGFVRLDNGEVIRRHRNFRFFATMNLGYFGTKELNQALYNRFNAIVELADLGDEAIERMLLARVPECRPVVAKMLGVYHKLRTKIGSDELDAVISPRNLENWARLAKYEGYVAAAEKSVVSIAKCDRPLEQAIRDIVMLYKWN